MPLAFGLIVLSALASAQSPFRDAKGKTSLFLPASNGFAQINIGDDTARLGYLYDISNRPFWFGFEAYGKLDGDRADLFDEDRLAPEAGLSLTYGKRFVAVRDPSAGWTSPAGIIDPSNAAALRRKIGIPDQTVLPGWLKGADGKVDVQKAIAYLEAQANGITVSDLQDEAKVRGQLGIWGPLPVGLTTSGAYDATKAAAYFNVEKDPPTRRLAVDRARATFDSLSFTLGVRRSQYRLFDSSASFEDQLSKRDFTGGSASLAYNILVGGTQLYGVSVGYERGNNSDSLTSVDVRDETSATSGGVTRLSSHTVKALQGDFNEENQIPMNFDAVFWPASLGGRIAFDAFTRTDLRGGKDSIVPGVSLFVTEKGSPLKVVGGLSFEYREGKVNAALIAGFNF